MHCYFDLLLYSSLSEKCKEVGTTLELCLLIRIIPYYLVRVLFGTAIPTSIFQFITIVFYTCTHKGSSVSVLIYNYSNTAAFADRA